MIVYSIAVEIGPARLPVIRVRRHLDELVRLELDEFERAGADRMLAHLRRRDVAGIDRRQARGEQREKRRLRPLQDERSPRNRRWVTTSQVAVPGLARVDPQLARRVLPCDQIPGAFDVGGGERLAVMPFDALAQLEGQPRAVLAPRPARSRDRARSTARLFCGTCWSNITRLLNTAIIGRSATTVVSSWIDMLAGLSMIYCLRMPPCFWASAEVRRRAMHQQRR